MVGAAHVAGAGGRTGEVASRVFLLTASRATLEHRIAQSADAQDWRTRNLDECLAAFESNDFGEHVATDGRTRGDVARSILQRLG